MWDCAHIRHSTTLGEQCLVGGKATIAYGVSIGNRVKINSYAYICNAVTIEDGVMIAAGVIFTNDVFPRATTSDLKQLRSSTPDEHTLPTLVKCGATIGAGAIIGCDLSIGRFAMIGMGSVVTKSVDDFHLVVGNPARSIGAVCRCGQSLVKWDDPRLTGDTPLSLRCSACDLPYEFHGQRVVELSPPDSLKDAPPEAKGALQS